MHQEYVFFASKRENPILYMNLLSILKLDNVFRLKIAVFTYKLLNKNICYIIHSIHNRIFSRSFNLFISQ